MTLLAERPVSFRVARDVDAETIGKRLTELRVERGFATQVDLARALRMYCIRENLKHLVAQSSVSRWESGAEIPSSMILPLCAVLHCTPDVFFTRPGEQIPAKQRGRPKKKADEGEG